MKLKYQLSIYTFLLILFAASISALADDKTYQLISMEFAPYNYTENGQFSGISADIVREILKRIGHPEEITSVPLARAYKMLEENDDIILFSRLRIPDREKLNKWVGPLAPFRLVLYAKQKSEIKITYIGDAKKIKVGCSRNSGGHRLLLENGFTDIEPLSNGTRNSLKLEKGRIDLWMTSELVGKYGAKANNVDPNQFEVVYEFQPVHSLYIAFSNNISDEVVAKWQKILDDLKAEGIYDNIINEYIKKLSI